MQRLRALHCRERAGVTVVRDRVTQLEAELKDVRAQRQAQYWAFTRQARAKPVDAALDGRSN